MFDRNRLAMNLGLFWGDDAYDVVSTKPDGRNSISLDPSRVKELVITSSLDTPYPRGYVMYSDDRADSRLANALDAPLAYIFLSVVVYDSEPISSSTKPKGEETFSAPCVVSTIELVDDTSTDSMLFKIGFEHADAMHFRSTLAPYSTYVNADETDTVSNILQSLFGSAKLEGKLDASGLDDGMRMSYLTPSNATLSTAVPYVLRESLNIDYGNADTKKFAKVVFNHVRGMYEIWTIPTIGTDGGFERNGDGGPSAYRKDANIVEIDGFGMYLSGNGRMLLANNGNMAEIPLVLGAKTQYAFSYGGGLFDVQCHEQPGLTFLSPQVCGDGRRFFPKYSQHAHNPRFSKDVAYESFVSTSRDAGGLYEAIDYVLSHTQYANTRSDVVLRRKAGDSVYVSVSGGHGTPFYYMDGSYVATEVSHRYLRDGGEDGSGSFMTYTNLFTPFATKNSFKLDKKM